MTRLLIVCLVIAAVPAGFLLASGCPSGPAEDPTPVNDPTDTPPVLGETAEDPTLGDPTGEDPTDPEDPIEPADTTLTPASAVSIQNEGSPQSDVTAAVQQQDDTWAPLPFGTVSADYYANGQSASVFDALSLTFAATDEPLTSAVLRVYLAKGDLPGDDGDSQHYLLQRGAQNAELEDCSTVYSSVSDCGISATNVSPAAAITLGTEIGWVEITVPAGWLPASPAPLELTLRLWNLRVDAVELDTAP